MWKLVSEEMPKERPSVFARLKGTDNWKKGMFESRSDDVNVTVQYSDGTRRTETMHTKDGKWDYGFGIREKEVIAWQPLPEPYEEQEA